jgi:hypothetical protein
MWPELAREIGLAWNGIGIVSRNVLVNGKVQAAFAFWFAAIVGSEAVKAKARAELETLPERSLASGDPDQLRVVWQDTKGNVHVASCRHGLRLVRSEEAFELGDAVEQRDGKLVLALATSISLQ